MASAVLVLKDVKTKSGLKDWETSY